ncbi:clusterin-associated protein 1 [Chytriomyces cf. hyalinus JEL632]|nr:clusterin-associated protein 1 [Chytriomyces cf. hyalinus JEL632]
MSFRELRSFTEKMRALGYPRLISMDSFRQSNFDAVADILFWLVKNYDPSVDILDDIETEQDRVHFIKSIATFMASKANIKLNTRKLYAADGYAVKELYKIASLLYEANRMHKNDDFDNLVQPPLDISSRLAQLKSCRTLAMSITDQGSKLYDSLKLELELRDIRQQVISRPFDLRSMEKAVMSAIEALKQQIAETRAGLEGLSSDENNLVAKIEKRKMELERAEKRLKSLQGVRPAYMDEYEKIEVDLVKLYEIYMDKFRNLSYLEQQLDEHDRIEQDKFEETEQSLKKMQSRLREEEMQLLRGDKEMHESVNGAGGRPSRPHAAGRRERMKKSDMEDSDSDGAEDPDGDSEGEDISVGISDGESSDAETAENTREIRDRRPGEGKSRTATRKDEGPSELADKLSSGDLIDRKEDGDSDSDDELDEDDPHLHGHPAEEDDEDEEDDGQSENDF